MWKRNLTFCASSLRRLSGRPVCQAGCRHESSQPSLSDQERELLYANPYPHIDKKDRDRLTRGCYQDHMKVRLVGEPEEEIPDVDPEQAPYSYVYKGNPDFGWFTRTESVTENEPERWFWVERLLPKYDDSPHLTAIPRELPSGYTPQSFVPPDLPYFVNRTRNGLYPVYKQVHHSESRGVETVVQNIEGDVWKFEQDLREWLRDKRPDLDYEPGVYEARGKILVKFDCVFEIVDFLRSKGF